MRILVALLALAIAAPAGAEEWWRAETDHFVIKSRDSEKETREFAADLERFDSALRSLQNMPIGEAEKSTANKLTVYRFGNQTDIARMAGSSESGIAGFFISNAGRSVAFVPANKKRSTSIKTKVDEDTQLNEKTVLQHEYTHYFMLQHFPAAYPAWYVEGYAELLGTIRLNDDGSFFVGEPPLHRTYQLTQMAQFRLEDMLDANHKVTGLEAYQFYGTGWALTHYLNFAPGRLAQLNEYLAAIGQGEDSLTAAKRIFGDLGQIEKELRGYIRTRMPGINVKPDNYAPPKVAMRPMTDAEAAVIRTEMRLGRGVDPKHAKDLLADAKAQAVQYAADYHAQAILAEAQLQAENLDEAERIGTQLLDTDPSAMDGWLILGSAATQRIKDDPTQAAKAREYFGKAAMLDRNDPRPLIGFYYTYVKAKEEPPEDAIIALETAFDHAGTDVGYRLLLARQLTSENRLDTARTVLLPIAFRGHDQGEEAGKENDDKPSLTKLLALVSRGERDAAIAMMDKMFEEEEEDGAEGG
ncbi:hypothetical protein [Altererythrobacter fulvus]|uniref:tetratricopeptide repeat protein n=1 Tax=Caenibius fulvus TaxID=2126012 RepID=UPI00301971A1